jgi:hypothetical protein
VFRLVVEPLVLETFDLRTHVFAGGAIGFEFVGGYHARRFDRIQNRLPHEPSCRDPISSALDQNVEHEACAIDGAPMTLPAAIGRPKAQPWAIATDQRRLLFASTVCMK